MTLGDMGEGGVQKNKKLGGIIYEQPHITLSIGSDYYIIYIYLAFLTYWVNYWICHLNLFSFQNIY